MSDVPMWLIIVTNATIWFVALVLFAMALILAIQESWLCAVITFVAGLLALKDVIWNRRP